MNKITTKRQPVCRKLFFLFLAFTAIWFLPLNVSAAEFDGAALAAKANKAAINYVDEMYTNKNEVLSLMRISYDNREYNEICAFTKKLVSGVTDKEQQAKILFDWVSKNITYSYDGGDYTAYDTLVNRKAVCMGYVTLYTQMLRSLEIPTVIVTGRSGDPSFAEDSDDLFFANPHAWNMIYLNGSWKITDPTKGAYDISVNDYNSDYCTWAVESITPSYSGIDYSTSSGMYYVKGNVYYYSGGKIEKETGGLSSSLNNYALHYRSITNGTGDVSYTGSVKVPKYAAFKNGWVNYQGDMFYALPNGTVVCSSWLNIKGTTYRFDHNGVRLPYSKNVTSDGFQYTISKDKKSVTIVAYTGTKKDIIIPSKIKGIPVTRIGAAAFYNVSCTSVTIPEDITAIDDNAFDHCRYLVTVVLPKSLRELGTTTNESYLPGSVFSWCSSLKNIVLKEGLKTIENTMFVFAFNQAKLTVPGSVSAIQPYTFTGAHLTELTLKEGVLTIDERAFSCMDDLKTLYLPSTITSIHKKAFEDTKNVTVVAKKGSYAYNWAKENKIKVKAATTSAYKLSSTRPSITIGKTRTLALTNTAGKTISSNVTWKSYDTSVAVVKNGIVTAKGYGTCAILATYNGTTTASVVTVNPATPSSVKLTKLVYQTIRKSTISWKKDSTVTGYEVYRSTSQNGTYERIKLTGRNTTVSYTDMSVKKGKTYYYKVRSYVRINGKNYYSPFSKIGALKY